jgi:hypothetical protein
MCVCIAYNINICQDIQIDRAPKHPIVFCHGLLGFDSVSIGPAIAPVQVTHWRGIKEVLEANGVEVLITRVPATSSVEDRAKVLEQRISDIYPGRSVHLIGHSMVCKSDNDIFFPLRMLSLGWTRLSLFDLTTPPAHIQSPLRNHNRNSSARLQLR